MGDGGEGERGAQERTEGCEGECEGERRRVREGE